jgi:hypothetical protein
MLDGLFAQASAVTSTQLPVQLLSEKAQLPSKGSKDTTGHDLYSAEEVVIPSGN